MSLRHRALRACAALTQARGAAAACSSVGLDANAATALPSSRMLHSAPPQPPQVAPSPSPASQQRRGISAAAVLMAEAKGGPAATAGGSGGAAVSSTQGDAGAAPGEGEEELEWDSDEEAAAEAVGEAFERLIQAAFQLVQEGKPMEAEYVLVEGAKQAEEILGPNALELAALFDQLCILRFLHERVPEAAEAARRALDILREHDEGFGPATAIASTRYASTLLAQGEAAEAQLYTGRSIDSLTRAMETLATLKAEDEEEEAELSETRDKFEVGLGESQFYNALAKQAQDLASPEGVGAHLADMQAGIESMAQHLGGESPLIAAALREHSRLIMSALEEDQRELAEALYLQDARLHMAAGGSPEHVALVLYQCGTLQYVMGKYDAAAETLQMSLQTVREHFPDAEEHLLTVQQRLGMVYGLLGRFDESRELLHGVSPALVANLGEGNPASEELEFTLALVGLREMEADGVTDAARRAEKLAAMKDHLEKLAGYGEEHMLVKKARQLHAEAAGGGGQ